METIVGIDLGTTNSEIAIIRDGKAVIIPIDGEKMMPSCVAINDNNECIVGRVAKNQMIINAEATILSIKRKMGEDVKVKLKDREFSPEEISSLILLELKKKAEEYLGEPIKKAVITVPAYFNDDQRKATKNAGQLAGLDVLRIINEPTAAALAYETSHAENQKLLVYDLGGGTFDVSVVVIESDVVEVKSSHGDTFLGGDDFDELLLNHIVKKFNDEHNIDLISDLTSKNRILKAVEKAKCDLSDNPFTKIREEFIYKDLHLDYELSRTEFEELIEPLIEKTISCVHKSLIDAGLLTTDLDHIILVGGSTRIPMIAKKLIQETNLEPISAINPDLIVAMGAAIQAGTIAGEKNQSVLVDITPRTFGVSAMGEIDGSFTVDMFVPIIKRNTPIPVQKTELFFTSFDNQEEINIKVYEGDEKYASDNNLIGEFNVVGLSKVEEGNQILCKLELDLNGILSVTAIEKKTGFSKTVNMQVPSSRGIFDILTAKENIASISGDRSNNNLLDENDEKDNLIKTAKSLKKRADELIDKIDQADAEELKELLSKSKKSISESDLKTLEKLNETISDMLFYLED